MMKNKDKEMMRIKMFVKHIIGEKGGFQIGGIKNDDGTFTLFPHTYRKMKNILDAKKFDDLNDENKKAINYQIEMWK